MPVLWHLDLAILKFPNLYSGDYALESFHVQFYITFHELHIYDWLFKNHNISGIWLQNIYFQSNYLTALPNPLG